MENILSLPEGPVVPALRIEARIEDINPLPPGFQWPPGVPEPMIKKAVVTVYGPAVFPAEIRRLALEIAHPDSKGNWVRCNSAPFRITGELSASSAPLIWDAQTTNRRYKASFSWHTGATAIKLYLKVYFADAALPVQQQEGLVQPNSKTPASHSFSFQNPMHHHEQGKN